MFNDQYKTIFIHFAKTGGSSIEEYFGTGDGYRESVFNSRTGAKSIIKENHHTSVKNFIAQNGQEVWDECFTFSFVRNPWDWFVSLFHWDLKVYWENHKNRPGHPQKRRRNFIVNKCNSNFETYVMKGAETNWFIFPDMIDYCQGVDYIGRFETLQKDFDHICRQIGAPVKKLGHVKKSAPRPHYSKFYNEKTKEIVYNLMKKDIEYFGYNFEAE